MESQQVNATESNSDSDSGSDMNLSDQYIEQKDENESDNNDNDEKSTMEKPILSKSAVTRAFDQCYKLFHFFDIIPNPKLESQIKCSDIAAILTINNDPKVRLAERLKKLCQIIDYNFNIDFSLINGKNGLLNSDIQVKLDKNNIGLAMALEVIDYGCKYHTIKHNGAKGHIGYPFVCSFQRVEYLGDALLSVLLSYLIFCQVRASAGDKSNSDKEMDDGKTNTKTSTIVMTDATHCEAKMTAERGLWDCNKHLAIQIITSTISDCIIWDKKIENEINKIKKQLPNEWFAIDHNDYNKYNEKLGTMYGARQTPNGKFSQNNCNIYDPKLKSLIYARIQESPNFKRVSDTFEAILGAIFIHSNWNNLIQDENGFNNQTASIKKNMNFESCIQFCKRCLGNVYWNEIDWNSWF